MSKKPTNGNSQKHASGRKHRDIPRKPSVPAIDPVIGKEIASILLAVLALTVFLGLVGAAGKVGQGVDSALSALFGISRFLVPVVILAVAANIAVPERFRLSLSAKTGIALLLVSWGGLVNLVVLKTPEAMTDLGRLSGAGGYVGLLAGYPILRLTDFWATAIILTGLIFTSLILTFNVTLRRIFSRLKSIPRVIRGQLPLDGHGDRDTTGYGESEPPENSAGFGPVAAGETAPQFTGRAVRTADAANVETDISAAVPPIRRKPPTVNVPIDLLDSNIAKPTAGDIQGRMFTIKKTLENFGIPVEMGDVSVGPTVTQFTLKPADGIKLTRITSLSNDLAMSLAAHPIRIEAPIPGKPLVGIEVPNKGIAIVGLREILDSQEFRNARKSSLTVCLGKDVAGKPWVADLGKMPHMLVAGATGSGKTVCLNTIILSLLYQNGPDSLRLLLIDPKRVELPVYNGIPHMLVPAVTEVPKIINALKWCIEEMDRRFTKLSEVGCRDIGSYNRQMRDGEGMPYIVVVIDELADLMVASASEVEASIIRLAQMARAVGIH
ncbi:hypothetical protein JW899_03620, partial [Candidatus Uhrbacteria bacterium]|nr:hypothetical protein [Candidatus Uhrbacteria bacterium]